METTKELKVIVFDSADSDFYIGHVDIIHAGELSTIVTKATIGADWIVKRWIKFQIAVKTFHLSKVRLKEDIINHHPAANVLNVKLTV